MVVHNNFSLRNRNTFGIDSVAEYFVEVHSIDELDEVSRLPYKKHVLGGGSNILLPEKVEGLVIRNCLKGMCIKDENAEYIWIESASGEVWHDLVMYAVSNGWGGLENLALIPGTVGAAPIQNIGAYGTEVANVISEVQWFHMADRTHVITSRKDCNFGYRESLFKKQLSQIAFITSVTFKLSKLPKLNTSYGAISEELLRMNTIASVRSVADAVIRIRQSKLPDPVMVGNAGSFFKNPTIPSTHFQHLVANFPSMPFFGAGPNLVKIPAGWLIEQCGWKGYSSPSGAGVHDRQALVLVNRKSASGKDILNLSEDILLSVKEKFGITLEREVQIW